MGTTLIDFLQDLERSGFYGSVELKYENGRLTVARKSYMIQREDRGGPGSTRPRRNSIQLRRVSTLTPALRIWIICSRVNPACSPAIASL